jgi:hypothetical protein
MTGGVIENNTIYAEYAATTMHPYIYGGAGVFMARYNTAPHTFVKTGGVIRGMTGPDANTIAGGLSAFTHPVEAIQFYFSDRRTAWYPNTVYYWADGAGATENINFDVNITQNSGTDVGNVITCADGLLRVEE